MAHIAQIGVPLVVEFTTGHVPTEAIDYRALALELVERYAEMVNQFALRNDFVGSTIQLSPGSLSDMESAFEFFGKPTRGWVPLATFLDPEEPTKKRLKLID